MSSIQINGDTSGSVTIQAPAVAGSTTLTLPATTGAVALDGPSFRAFATGVTSVTSSYNKIALADDSTAGTGWDTANAFDAVTNYRFTPQVAGYYQISASIYYASSTYAVACIIRKNGAAYIETFTEDTQRASSASGLVYLNGSTDYVELFGHSGTTQNATPGSTVTWMSGFLARAA